MARPDSRSDNEKRYARRFEVVKSNYEDANATPFDSRIAELRRPKHNIVTDEGHAAWLEDMRDEKLGERDTAALNKEYTAAMYQDATVQKLLRLQAYYESDESVDAKLLQKVSEAVEQYTTPGASRVVAETWANEVFALEQNRRAAIESQLNERSQAWNRDAAKLQAERLAIDGLPETTPVEAPAPVTYEKSIKLKSTYPLAAAYELFIALPADSPERAEVDAALDRKTVPGVLEAVIEKYAAPAVTESEAA